MNGLKTIGIIGFGELGRQIKVHLEDSLSVPLKFIYFDDILHKVEPDTVLPFYAFREIPGNEIEYIVGLGYHHLPLKKELYDELIRDGKPLLSFIHSTSFVNKRSELGEGVIIYPKCNIDMGCNIGNGVLLNNSVTVSHDTAIGSASYLSPGVTISGKVKIGESTFIGSGVNVSNGVSVGDRCVIGIGSTVTKDLPTGTSGIGNPFCEKRISLC